jgi:hypothetical protein
MDTIKAMISSQRIEDRLLLPACCVNYIITLKSLFHLFDERLNSSGMSDCAGIMSRTFAGNANVASSMVETGNIIKTSSTTT